MAEKPDVDKRCLSSTPNPILNPLLPKLTAPRHRGISTPALLRGSRGKFRDVHDAAEEGVVGLVAHARKRGPEDRSRVGSELGLRRRREGKERSGDAEFGFGSRKWWEQCLGGGGRGHGITGREYFEA
ncbi:hypothetical protein FH972_007958 [Carpinus fangiana]|uniref:Uncharacterized protein n=1 Tax=Carpinus fangiana TaxID=176857 RepID=A0A5N6QY10_9ROSI|nr:hypothetical protein FH972_007958 [Carpinus fangiana]